MTKQKIYNILHFTIVAVFGIIMLIPFYFVIINSFKSYGDIMSSFSSLPKKIYFGNFSGIIKLMSFATAFRNSVVVTMFSVIFTVLIGSITGHTLQRMGTKFAKSIYYYFIAGLSIPFHAIMVPLLKTVKDVGGLNSLIVLAIVYIAFNMPFCTFLYYGFATSVPLEVEESAIIDGCRPIKMFYYIIFPLLKPATFTAAVLFFSGIGMNLLPLIFLLLNRKKEPLCRN